MSATLVAASLAVFGSYGAWLVVQEADDLGRATERELRFLGTSLRVGLENALRDRQLSDVEETTLRLEGVDTPIDVLVFDPGGRPVAAPGGLPAGLLRERVDALVHEAAQSGETRVERSPEVPAHTLLLATPLLSDDGETLGTLVLLRTLDDVNADLFQTWGSVAFTVGSFVLVAGLVGTVVGDRWLARPLDRLAGAMRRVRQGELGARLGGDDDDEIAAVTREFDAMTADLAGARRRADEEAQGRRAAMHSLQAADRLVTLGQLSGAVAHEIGSPLQVLHGRARALAERPQDVEHTARVARVLVHESERIGRIVGQLLSLTRLRPPQQRPTDLVAASSDVCDLLELEARRLRVALIAPRGSEVVVHADPDQVRQVVLNLVSNALAACSSGGTVTVSVAPSPSGAWLRVTDDGAGMGSEARARAFEPLFTTRADHGGAGLGLAVVRSIVNDHGGDVRFESEEGRGTTFVVDWPRGGGAA